MHQGSQTLESIAHDEGRFLAVQGASGTEFIDTWHVRDYLGSVRAVYDITPEPVDVTSAGSQILEQNDYYAFGGRIEVSGQAFDQTNRYRYNGKEQLRFEGINLDPGLTDYGARYYAPTFGRWTTPDPLADKYYSISPYGFCNNNPVNFVDPDGELPVPVVGAIIGGAISGTAAIIKGKTFTEVIAATAGGAVDGAIGAVGGGVAKSFCAGAIGGGVGSLVEQGLNKLFGNQTEIDAAEIAVSAAFGAMTGTIEGAGENLGRHIEDFYSSDKTVKSIAKEIKDNSSRRMTNKQATSEAKKVAEDAKKKEKNLVEESANIITYTWNFYYNLQDE